MHVLGTGARIGHGDYLVAEADESDGSFLKLSPTLALVTNIDDDHLDYWKTRAALDAGFEQFANKVPFYGTVFLGIDDPGSRQLREKIRRPLVTYGLSPEADIRAEGLEVSSGSTSYTVKRGSEVLGVVRWTVPGRHNVINSLGAISVGLALDVPFQTIAQALASFEGVSRRLEIVGEAKGVTVVDDYGHHPTEVRATLQALKERWPHHRRLVVFQPHRYSRTQLLAEAFGLSFGEADHLFLTEIYAASEAPIPGVTSDWLAQKIAPHTSVERLSSVADLVERVKPGDVVLTLGAGDVWKMGEQLLQAVRGRS
jgi:UDP-N-acetylmuramate--alanine ligase